MIYKIAPKKSVTETSRLPIKKRKTPIRRDDNKVKIKVKQPTPPPRTLAVKIKPNLLHSPAVEITPPLEDEKDEAIRLYDERRRLVHLSSEHRRRERLSVAFERAKEVLNVPPPLIDGIPDYTVKPVMFKSQTDVVMCANQTIANLEMRKRQLEQYISINKL